MIRVSRRDAGKLLIAGSAGAVAARRPLFGAVNAVQIVESFWTDVWVARNPEAVDRYVVDDFVITSAGKEIRSRDSFKRWVTECTLARASVFVSREFVYALGG